MMDVPEANHCIPFVWVNSFLFRWTNGSRSAPSVDQKPWKQGNHPNNNMDRIGSKGWHNLPGKFGLLKDNHLLCPPASQKEHVRQGSVESSRSMSCLCVFKRFQKYVYIIYNNIYIHTIIYCFRVMMFLLNLVILAAFLQIVVCSMRLSAQVGPSAHLKTWAPSRQRVNRCHCPVFSSVQSQKCHCSNPQSIWYQWVYSYIPWVNYRMLWIYIDIPTINHSYPLAMTTVRHGFSMAHSSK